LEALRDSSAQVRSLGHGHWEALLSDNPASCLTVRWLPDWLLFTAPDERLPREPARSLAGLVHILKTNAALPAGVRVGIESPGAPQTLTSQLPLDESTDVRERVVAASSAFSRALTGAWKGGREQVDAPRIHAARQPESKEGRAPVDRLLEQSQATGWRHSRRGERILVELDVADLGTQADLVLRDRGRLDVTVELARGEFVEPVSGAISLLMLSASHAVHMVRAAVAGEGSELVWRWEVGWEQLPGVFEFTHGLAALSVACRLTVREARALEEEGLARQYLAVRGWSP
jgi:hypothetical protein